MDFLRESFDQARRDVPRALTVLAAPSILLEELRQPAAAFCREHPEIKLTLLSVAIFSAVEQLVSGAGDMAILSRDNVESVAPHFTAEPLCARHAALVLLESHKLARKRRLTLADLVREPLILPEAESPWRQSVEEVSVREWFPSQEIVILWRRGVSPRPQARLFADFLRQKFAP